MHLSGLTFRTDEASKSAVRCCGWAWHHIFQKLLFDNSRIFCYSKEKLAFFEQNIEHFFLDTSHGLNICSFYGNPTKTSDMDTTDICHGTTMAGAFDMFHWVSSSSFSLVVVTVAIFVFYIPKGDNKHSLETL